MFANLGYRFSVNVTFLLTDCCDRNGCVIEDKGQTLYIGQTFYIAHKLLNIWSNKSMYRNPGKIKDIWVTLFHVA